MGIPARTFSVGNLFPDYHQPGDEWQKIDCDNMTKVVRTLALGVHRVADRPVAPSWNAGNPKAAPYRKARVGGAP